MSTKSHLPARPALGDASKRANQTPILPPPGLKAAGQPSTSCTDKPVPKTGSKKRKSETSLEDEIAAYKQHLDISTDKLDIDVTCNQLRGKINKLLDSGIMKKGEFCRAIGCNANSVNTFLSKRGSMEGEFSNVYTYAWSWFKQRELAGLKMPNVNKRQKTEAAASNGGARSSATGNATAPLASATDISGVQLSGEDKDSVPVYDTCDEIRKKINAHLQTPGLTAAQFCRDIYAQLKQPKVKSFQSKQLSDFRGKKGPTAGCTSQVFYAAYVYFEKKRIAEGKPKSKHRLNMEKIWAKEGGFDREHDGRHGVWVMAGKRPSVDQYGQYHFR
ncbi:hypothetical protein F5Y05DRAFT_22728 [Hypoxylon sp. FL0543]|nr:hypothetical protein F5Y05DRAFT_22728 [Hypoxylon sp. FL0543]